MRHFYTEMGRKAKGVEIPLTDAATKYEYRSVENISLGVATDILGRRQ